MDNCNDCMTKMLRDILGRAKAKLKIYYEQTRGEYHSGEALQFLLSDIDKAIAALPRDAEKEK